MGFGPLLARFPMSISTMSEGRGVVSILWWLYFASVEFQSSTLVEIRLGTRVPSAEGREEV